MAKKSFLSGLDNLLSSAGIKKKNEIQDVVEEKVEIKTHLSDEEKQWLSIKIDRLREELKLWRTGDLSVEDFNNSLLKHGLTYDSNANEIIEK